MTRKEAIQNSIPIEVGDLMLEKVCIDFDLDMEIGYTSSDIKSVELVVAELCKILAALPDITEGTLTITHNRSELLQIRSEILNKYATTGGGVNSPSVW